MGQKPGVPVVMEHGVEKMRYLVLMLLLFVFLSVMSVSSPCRERTSDSNHCVDVERTPSYW